MRWDLSKDGVRKIQFSQGTTHQTPRVHLFFSGDGPCGLLFRGHSQNLAWKSETRTFRLSWVTQKPQASTLFCPTIIDGAILFLSSQVSFVMCTRPCNNYMWFFLFNYAGNVSSSGFLTTDSFCKRFRVNYFICREYWTQKKKNPAPRHFFPFLKSSLLTPSCIWPCPCIRDILGQISNHLLEVKNQANSHFPMCDPLLLASEWIDLAKVEVNTTFGLIISTLTWYEVWQYLLPAKLQLPLPLPPSLLLFPLFSSPFLAFFPLSL